MVSGVSVSITCVSCFSIPVENNIMGRSKWRWEMSWLIATGQWRKRQEWIGINVQMSNSYWPIPPSILFLSNDTNSSATPLSSTPTYMYFSWQTLRISNIPTLLFHLYSHGKLGSMQPTLVLTLLECSDIFSSRLSSQLPLNMTEQKVSGPGLNIEHYFIK